MAPGSPGCLGDMGSDLTLGPGLTLCLTWGGELPDTERCGILKPRNVKKLKTDHV